MPARKKAPARKRAAKRKAPVRRSRSKKQSGPSKSVLVVLLLISLACLAVSVFMLIEEKRKAPEMNEMERKLHEMKRMNPDAEIFNLEQPEPKKKVKSSEPVKTQPQAPTVTPPPPAPKPKPAPAPAPIEVSLTPVTRQAPTAPPAPTPSVVPTPAPAPKPVTPPPAPAPQPAQVVRKAERVVGPEPTTQLDVAAWQIRLERHHFSMGTIDGDYGMRSRRAVTQFQQHHGLPVTGELDFETRYKLGMPGNPFQLYTVTPKDMAKIQPPPATWRAKSEAEYLGYHTMWISFVAFQLASRKQPEEPVREM